jgi:N-acetylglucosaminyldiphosphoundecaprenol N-acetyl-beta-D-mannosaminyltransferase
MMRKIEIAGLQFDNYSVDDTMRMLDKASAERAFFSIAEVDADMILRAGSDETMREAFGRLNHTILADEVILKAAGQYSAQRQHEITERRFYQELMRKLELDQVPVCLLGDTEMHTAAGRDLILQQFPDMNIADMEILEQYTGELDKMINEINAKTQNVVISLLPSPAQEEIFLECREKLSAGLWYGMGAIRTERHRKKLADYIRDWKRQRALTRLMTGYREQEAI